MLSASLFSPKQTTSITDISAFEFLYQYIRCGNFHDAVDSLEKKHDNINFKVSLAYLTLFQVIQNKEDVKKILSAKTNLGLQNHNFDVSHGHDLSVVATQAYEPDGSVNVLWKNIHKALAQSGGDQALINKLIAKHIPKFFAKPQFDLDVVFEDFMLDFWCEYMFGAKVNATEFKDLRKELLSTLRYTFYDSRLKVIPYVGTQACKFYRYLKKDALAKTDETLLKFISQSEGGIMQRFKEKLQASDDFPQEKIDKAVLDNAFIFIIVFDFIHNAMYESLVSILKSELDATADRKKAYNQGLHNAYLFPFRSRVAQEDITLSAGTIAKGSSVFINLLKSELYHSFGPRSCVGIGISNWIKEAIWNHLEDTQLRIVSTSKPKERADLSYSKDVPISPERYNVEWNLSRDYLQKHLPHYDFRNVEEFFDVLKIYENPVLSGYIASQFLKSIDNLKLDVSNLTIATPEVRGIPIASMVAQYLHVPLVILRKPNKIPGPVLTKEYGTAYSKDTLQVSCNSDIAGKDVVLIDDGIATGGTTVACCELIESLGGHVKDILGIINHINVPKEEALSHYQTETLFDIRKRIA